MLKDLLRTFLDGAIAGILYFNIGGYISAFLPPLPFGISSAIALGILVLVVDYILHTFAKL